VKADAQGGWTPELAARALTVLRIGGAVALGRPVAQRIVAGPVTPHEGQLALRKGFLGKRHALVSNATTPGTIAKSMAAAAHGQPMRAKTEAMLKELEESLAALSTARYSRGGTMDGSKLDTALDNGIDVLKKLRNGAMWPARTVRSITNQAMEIGWSR